MKTLIATVAASLVLSACGTTGPERGALMSHEDLNSFVPNCFQPEEQMALLKYNLQNTSRRDTRAAILVSINYINRYCPESLLKRKPGCVYARETTDKGVGTAEVCRTSNGNKPIVNRWETDIDN